MSSLRARECFIVEGTDPHHGDSTPQSGSVSAVSGSCCRAAFASIDIGEKLKRSQKCYQGLLVFRRQGQPELVALHGARRHAIALETGGHVVVAKPPWSNQSSSVATEPMCSNGPRYQTPLSDGTL